MKKYIKHWSLNSELSEQWFLATKMRAGLLSLITVMYHRLSKRKLQYNNKRDQSLETTMEIKKKNAVLTLLKIITNSKYFF